MKTHSLVERLRGLIARKVDPASLAADKRALETRLRADGYSRKQAVRMVAEVFRGRP